MLDDEGPLPLPLTLAGPEARREAAVRAALLRLAMGGLAESDAALLEARVVEGRRYADIARETGANQRTLQSRVTRLLDRVRRHYEDYERTARAWHMTLQ